MKYKIIYLLAFVMLLGGCSNDDDTSKDSLTIYEEGNLKITLIYVNDGRCPENANCVWEGNAAVDMRIEKGNQEMDFTLNTYGMINDETNLPSSTVIFDQNIELIDLQPYPESEVLITLDEYVVTLHITDL